MRMRAAILASTLGLAPSRAEPAAPTALSWHREPGAEACPGLREVAAKVSAHLERDPFAAPAAASVFVEATIAPAPGGWTTRIDLSSSSGSNGSGQRIVESSEPECGAAVDAAALAIALMIDPNALLRGRVSDAPELPAASLPTPTLSKATPQPPAAEASRRCPPETLVTPQSWRTRLALGGLASVGQLPAVSGGAWFDLRLSPATRRVGLEIAFAYLAPREARVRAEAGGEFSSLSALGSVFWTPARGRRLALSLIGGVEVGRILASGFGFQSFRSQGAWAASPTVELELSLEAAPTWEVLFRLGGGIPLLRHQFEFDLNGESRPIFRPAGLFGRAAAGVAFAP